jgi:endo-1,4-beta-xylanase
VFVSPPTLRSSTQVRGLDIGAAVDIPEMQDTAFLRVLTAEFNSVTPGNAMKFGPIHPQPGTYAFANADTIMGLAAQNGMKVHGHVLVWHNQQPAWITAATQTRTTLLAALKEHIETVVGRYAGKIATWDVANETIADDGSGLRKTFWINVIGPDVIDSAFTWARRRDPSAKLFLNDYAVEGVNRKSDSLFALASRLKAAGVPIDGIGLQAHFVVAAPTLAQMSANVARFAALGLDVRFTELDVRLPDGTDNLANQATIYGNTMMACRGQPRCHALTVWVNGVPWIAPTADSRDDWGGYAVERREIADFIQANRIENLAMLSGDAHMLATDDGSNNRFTSDGTGPGFPVFHAAALDRRGKVKGGPYSEGTFPGEGQFGLMTVDDTESAITVTWSGRDWTGAEILGYQFTVAAPS